MTFRVNPNFEREFLASAGVRAAVHEAAEAVASNVRVQGIKVGDVNGGPDEVDLPVGILDVDSGTAASLVTLLHPAGENVQAKHGALTKAAAATGLKVRAIQ